MSLISNADQLLIDQQVNRVDVFITSCKDRAEQRAFIKDTLMIAYHVGSVAGLGTASKIFSSMKKEV